MRDLAEISRKITDGDHVTPKRTQQGYYLLSARNVLNGRIDAQQAFAASQLDESFQIEGWGEDSEQTERRHALAADIEAAAKFITLLRA